MKKKFLILFINLQFWSLFLESRLQSVSLYLYNLITLYIHVIPLFGFHLCKFIIEQYSYINFNRF